MKLAIKVYSDGVKVGSLQVTMFFKAVLKISLVINQIIPATPQLR